MFGSYLKVALRNLRQYKAYSAINVIGLAIGLTVTLLMLMYAANELSYENFHEKGNRTYRASVDWGSGDNIMRLPGAMGPLGPAVVEQIPEVEGAVRFIRQNSGVEVGGSSLSQLVYYADAGVFDMFSFPLISGDAKTALEAPYSAVVTRELAEKFFGSADAAGKTLTLDGEHTVLITGVMENIPVNTMLRTEFLISMSTLVSQQVEGLNNWNSSGSIYTYLLLGEEASVASVLEQMRDIHAANAGEFSASRSRLRLQKFTDIHLKSEALAELGRKGNLTHVYLSITVAFLVLAIACFNYINLATARSMRRAKEISMRRVLGASRRNLVLQLFGESLLTTLIAIVCGLALYEVLIGDLSAYLGVVIEENPSVTNYPYLLSGILLVAVGFLAGCYPAWAMSRSGNDVRSSKVVGPLSSGSTLRRVLVAGQFAVSIGLMVVTAVTYNQIDFMKNSDLGFDKSDVLLVDFDSGDERWQSSYPVLRNEIERLPSILGAAGTGKAPGVLSESQFTVRRPDEPDEKSLMMDHICVDAGFVRTLGLQLLGGRSFEEVDADVAANAAILNESAVRLLGFDDPLGQPLILMRDETTIIGVVQDFHVNSFQEEIQPLVLHVAPDQVDLVAARFKPGEAATAMAEVEGVWHRVAGDEPFRARFLDETYESLYLSDEKTGEMLMVFALLAVLVSCLGLAGLSAFSTERRTAEIGVRKVLGASVVDIIRLISREFVVLVLIANTVAWPIAYYLAEQWLAGFAYRVDIGWQAFALSALLALVIALSTISFQAVKAACLNPVETLRHE